MAASEAVAADLMRRAVGEPGAVFISLLVIDFGSINATISQALALRTGAGLSLFAFLDAGANVPIHRRMHCWAGCDRFSTAVARYPNA